MTAEKTSSAPVPRYGWVIVAAMLLVQTVSSGLGFYNMSVYINRLAAELTAPWAKFLLLSPCSLLSVVWRVFMWRPCCADLRYAPL